LEVLRNAAARPIERGAAELLIDDRPHDFYGVPTYRLVPRNPAASPVEVHADRSGTYLHVGHRRSLHELWQDDVEERRRHLHACVAAVVAGGYDETYEPWKKGSRLTMTFHTPAGPVEVLHHGSRAGGDPSFGITHYEPYELEDRL